MRNYKHNKFQISQKLQQVSHRLFNHYINKIAIFLKNLHFFVINFNKINFLAVSNDGEWWDLADIGTYLLLITYDEMSGDKIRNFCWWISLFLSVDCYSGGILLDYDLGYIILEHSKLKLIFVYFLDGLVLYVEKWNEKVLKFNMS